MKSNTKKRLIAFMLCMVLVLSSATSAFADEPQNTDSQSQTEVVTEPVADEAQNTDSQSQAEVVTEPAADEATEDTTTEDTTTEDTTTEDTTTEDVSTENTITEDVSDTPDIEIPSKKEWSVQVGNATVKVNGSADALPADAQLSVTEITSEDEVKELEKAVEEKVLSELLMNKRLEDIMDLMNRVVSGNVLKRQRYMYQIDGNISTELDISSLSTGLKAFVIIKQLLLKIGRASCRERV